jgi:DNA-binding CsgD family transcriptional regulator
VGNAIRWVGDVYAGRLRPAECLVTDGPPTGNGAVRRDHPVWVIGCLISLGDSREARRHAERVGLADADLPPSHRGALALLECRPESPVLAWRALAENDDAAAGLTRASFHYLLVGLSVAAGQIGVARQLIEAARKEAPIADHVVEVADVLVDLALGEAETSEARLVAALERARGDDLLVGTELILSLLVSLAQARRDDAGARLRVQELDEVARALQSPRASMHAAFGRAMTHRDTTAVEAFLRLAEEAGPEYETTHLTLRLVRAGLADPALLSDVYAVYGRLDAPLARAWTRSAMESHGVTVPGRAQTKAENERLLGRLLIEGLSNRQIATLLGSSAKSVEGRLGRLFARTGYRSRIELASALLDHGSLGHPRIDDHAPGAH